MGLLHCRVALRLDAAGVTLSGSALDAATGREITADG